MEESWKNLSEKLHVKKSIMGKVKYLIFGYFLTRIDNFSFWVED